MYYPYFRGKQFDLIAIRESASVIADSGFVPVIEPVRASLSGLEKTLDSLAEVKANSVVIVNPRHGDHKENRENLSKLMERQYEHNEGIGAGILLTSDTELDQIRELTKDFDRSGTTLVHAGFTDARGLAQEFEDDLHRFRNVFLADQTNRLYRRHFKGQPRVLVDDSFVQMRNADYPPLEAFSDLHITFREDGMDGYGDFLTVGDNYSDTGGPAYAVAIHLTYIDPDQDDAMFVYHFKSDTNDTPTDPAGKFAQALDKLIYALNSGDSKLCETSAIHEFKDLYNRQHFPGLGYVKKLSIKHHLETLAQFHTR